MTKWQERAEIGQMSFDYYYASDDAKQLYNNFYPTTDVAEDNKIFNYWWLAHLIDARLDGYLRTGEQRYLDMADQVYRYSKHRNGDTLIHDFYDDMLWNGLALLRFYEITKNDEYLAEAKLIWQDLVDTAWNDIAGGGFAWRRPQMYYKNTPVNGPFIILSTRLYQLLGDEPYLDWALKTYEWQKQVLVRSRDGFVEDGINRENDGKIDCDWQFTYNQGVYIGANVELFKITGEHEYLDAAMQTAKTAIELLTVDGVFKDEGEGGDEGLFKGIYYRYLIDLLELQDDEQLRDFVFSSCEQLWQHCFDGKHLLASKDWRYSAKGKIAFSTELSAMFALEMAAKIGENGE